MDAEGSAMFREVDTPLDVHRLSANCYINHFMQTRPYGMVPDSPRLLAHASNLGLVFAVPITNHSDVLHIHVYDVLSGAVSKVKTFTRNALPNFRHIDRVIFAVNHLFIYAKTTSTLFALEWLSMQWRRVFPIRSEFFFEFPLIVDDNGQFLTAVKETDNNTEIIQLLQFSFDEHLKDILPRVYFNRMKTNHAEPNLDSDIDGHRALYDRDSETVWNLCFVDKFMNFIYSLRLPGRTSTMKEKPRHVVEWNIVNLQLNPEFSCPLSIHYSKCFLRKSVVYWFMPSEETTQVWTLNLKNTEKKWLPLEVLPYTIFDVTFDEDCDEVYCYCASVDFKTYEYPWDPCNLRLKKFTFRFPQLQQLAWNVVAANLYPTKLRSESDLQSLSLPFHLKANFWRRVEILKQLTLNH